jgi:hypothetical protein
MHPKQWSNSIAGPVATGVALLLLKKLNEIFDIPPGEVYLTYVGSKVVPGHRKIGADPDPVTSIVGVVASGPVVSPTIQTPPQRVIPVAALIL